MWFKLILPSNVMYFILLVSKGPTTTSSAILLVPFTKFVTIIFYYHIFHVILCYVFVFVFVKFEFGNKFIHSFIHSFIQYIHCIHNNINSSSHKYAKLQLKRYAVISCHVHAGRMLVITASCCLKGRR